MEVVADPTKMVVVGGDWWWRHRRAGVTLMRPKLVVGVGTMIRG